MNKTNALMLAVLMTVTLASLAYADQVVVAGKIYTDNFAIEVPGANVNVWCNDQNLTTVSRSPDGAYMVKFEDDICNERDEVTVYAEKDGLTGSDTGLVYDGKEFSLNMDFAVANVNLIPEFGLLIGTLTVISAIAVFFIIRRK